MRYHILTAALATVGLLATSGPADAQYGYPYPPSGRYYRPYAPAPRYAPPQYPQPSSYPGYSGGDAAFVRSLYHRYLNREPDPQGMDTWLWKLAAYGGDTDRVVREFVPAAQLELYTNRYEAPADRYAFPAYRPRYR